MANHLKVVPELYCQDILETKRFYIDVLGFTVAYERLEEQFVYFTLDGVSVMFEGIKGVEYKRLWLTAPLQRPFGRGINLQWDVIDVECLYSRVQEKSPHSVYLPMEVKAYQCGDEQVYQKQFIIQDPDGYLFRFCSEVV